MSCTHERIQIGKIEAKATPGGVALELGAITCASCGIALRLAREEARRSRDRDGFEVRLDAVGFDPGRLRCDRCGVRLFGRAAHEGAILDRGTIVGVDCGQPHVVHYDDGVALSVGEGVIEEVR